MEEAGERPLLLPLPFFLPAWSVDGSCSANVVECGRVRLPRHRSNMDSDCLLRTLAAALHKPLVPRQHIDAGGAGQERLLLRRVHEAAG